jgi:hypothetical protein
LHDDLSFRKICELLEMRSSELEQVSFAEKDAFVMLFAEVYLLWNSKMFNNEVVYYMFGYYALLCDRDEGGHFWSGGLDKGSPSYGHFRKFIEGLRKVEKAEGYVPNAREFTLAIN